jgi:hypothetical protein
MFFLLRLVQADEQLASATTLYERVGDGFLEGVEITDVFKDVETTMSKRM